MMSCTTEVSPEDAAKLRDIALVWWPEYYPDQFQNLLTQMYGWKAPGINMMWLLSLAGWRIKIS
jgi:hypothetical protein